MKKELVEIYSNTSNIAVMKHPGRAFPGSLIQGDSLHCLVRDLREVKNELSTGKIQDASEELDEIIELLEDRLDHYKKVLREHDCKLPFVD